MGKTMVGSILFFSDKVCYYFRVIFEVMLIMLTKLILSSSSTCALQLNRNKFLISSKELIFYPTKQHCSSPKTESFFTAQRKEWNASNHHFLLYPHFYQTHAKTEMV